MEEAKAGGARGKLNTGSRQTTETRPVVHDKQVRSELNERRLSYPRKTRQCPQGQAFNPRRSSAEEKAEKLIFLEEKTPMGGPYLIKQ